MGTGVIGLSQCVAHYKSLQFQPNQSRRIFEQSKVPELPQLQQSSIVGNVRITAQAIASPAGGTLKTSTNSWPRATLCTRFAIPLLQAASLSQPGRSLQSRGQGRCMSAPPVLSTAGVQAGGRQQCHARGTPGAPTAGLGQQWVQKVSALPHPSSVRCGFPPSSGNIVGRLAR